MSGFHAYFQVDKPSNAGNGTMKSIGSRRKIKQKRIMQEEKKSEEKGRTREYSSLL
jgi:hypothetical protein